MLFSISFYLLYLRFTSVLPLSWHLIGQFVTWWYGWFRSSGRLNFRPPRRRGQSRGQKVGLSWFRLILRATPRPGDGKTVVVDCLTVSGVAVRGSDGQGAALTCVHFIRPCCVTVPRFVTVLFRVGILQMELLVILRGRGSGKTLMAAVSKPRGRLLLLILVLFMMVIYFQWWNCLTLLKLLLTRGRSSTRTWVVLPSDPWRRPTRCDCARKLIQSKPFVKIRFFRIRSRLRLILILVIKRRTL